MINPLFGDLPSPTISQTASQLLSQPPPPPPRVPHPGQSIPYGSKLGYQKVRDSTQVSSSYKSPSFNFVSRVDIPIRADPLRMYPPRTPLDYQIAHRDWAYRRYRQSYDVTPAKTVKQRTQYLDPNVVGNLIGKEDPLDVQQREKLAAAAEAQRRSFAGEVTWWLHWIAVVLVVVCVGYCVAGPFGVGLLGLLVSWLMSR